MRRSMESDPIREAYSLWIENGWTESAEGLAAVSSILRVNQVLARQADQILAPINLTFARYEVLVVLYFNDGSLPLARLGRQLQVHQTSVTNLIDKLEAQGLIKRTPHPTDRRSTVAQITTAGSSLLRKAIKRLNADLFSNLGLTSEETRLLIAVLAKMRHSWGDFKEDQGWDIFALDGAAR
ncbi:MAG TPA: MarR family transcriptional regulator [Streptosporangiaceae bacterium]